MKRKTVSQLLMLGLCGAVLVGCSSIEDTKTSTSSIIKSEDIDATGNESSSTSTEMSSSSTNQTDQKTPSDKQIDVVSELKMNPDLILLPTAFPTTDSSSITSDILTNEKDNYSVSYLDNQGELAEVTGTVYENTASASDEMATFSNGKVVEPHEERGSDLGHDITGYSEGAAGTHYFSWEEGNWVFSIRSVSEDQMNNPGIAKKIVDYLEEQYLPAPNDKGIVYIHYHQGGEEVDVDIRWQDRNIVYQLNTTRVPLEALEMVVSMNQP
ncbi:hypothetical protein CAT7_10255 [Carnobacterium sp. AT7]|uniref:hypothetical protein n=1 Tax=Carnobacterium sp. AT7 TaxID=333990 RepID=UPI00015F1531|nr:hypothetical protein [Carnobacterium sp. AT7]EDP68796.1 hypothetical protein CAT7_10255 [Carnobacterium sp. AT7]